MNNRDYKIFAPDHYYHVFNRGVGKMEIFRDDSDYRLFLYRLRENLFPASAMVPFVEQREPLLRRRNPLPENSFSLIAYCLMPNHFHLLIRQRTEITVSKLILKVATSYSKYFNKKYKRVGSLFQDAFKAVLVESDTQLLWLSAYIHNNPRTDGLVKNAEDWKYGSYPDYVGTRQGTLCEKALVLKQFSDVLSYQSFVESSFEKIKQRKDLEYLLLDN